MKVFLGVVAIALLIVVAFAMELGGLEWNKFFAPRKENVRRQVFEQTKSYNQAKLQELVKYRLEYMRTDDAIEKSAIASTIRLGFADYNVDELPLELQTFINGIKYK
jgi:hypothetical protein